VGLFKIASRMLSRDKNSVPLLQIISNILTASGDSVVSMDSLQSWVELEADGTTKPVVAPGVSAGISGTAPSSKSTKMRKSLVNELANQVNNNLC
jgi:ABC-type uncharacterized transport system substrate-binding protein